MTREGIREHENVNYKKQLCRLTGDITIKKNIRKKRK